jgi:hypothetical protein
MRVKLFPWTLGAQMTRVMIGIAIVALAIVATIEGSFEARAAESWRCSQLYFSTHEACLKRNSQAQCDRVLGNRKAVCLRTGCWRGNRINKCGITRL